MNRKEAKGAVKHAALIAAFAEGAHIEFKDQHGNWYPVDEPAFGVNVEYRVKPEPRRFWRVELENGHVWSSCHSTEEAAKSVMDRVGKHYRNIPRLRVVEYVEVVK